MGDDDRDDTGWELDRLHGCDCDLFAEFFSECFKGRYVRVSGGLELLSVYEAGHFIDEALVPRNDRLLKVLLAVCAHCRFPFGRFRRILKRDT
ncbi:hypothetical protein B4915_01000 [Leucobacter massiliensis]|uniref:Uncharacterized protein n=1 Tax=Leucobacter massiliensis TaxID=1686285 RepID=A0A2S9QSH5_9MICO|nr:hypothetical protein B4915_01000 [Leucobacter massiliensis]